LISINLIIQFFGNEKDLQTAILAGSYKEIEGNRVSESLQILLKNMLQVDEE
jgi:hypothetical protein